MEIDKKIIKKLIEALDSLKKSLKDVNGINNCEVNFDSKSAIVTYENKKINKDEIANIISEKTFFKVTEKKVAKNNNKKSWSFFGWLFGKN